MKFYGVDQVYSESGVDLTLLRENLRRSEEDRLRKNCRALRSLHAFDRECRSNGHEARDERGQAIDLDIEGILQTLVTHQVKFVLIGGLALRAHGSAYITEDADFCYERSPQNIQALAAAMAAFHPYMRGAPPGLPFKFDARTISAGLNFTLTTELGDIDFLGEVSGLGFYDKVLAASETKIMFGHSIQVSTLDGLIAAKKAAGRRKDQAHLLELEELKKLKQSKS